MHWMRKQSLFFVAWTLIVSLSTASMVAVANTSKDAAQGPLVGTRFDESAEAEIAATVKAHLVLVEVFSNNNATFFPLWIL